MNEKPDARKESVSIPPGFQPMPAMTILPILGRTASERPIAVKENGDDEAFCRALYQEYEADPDKGQPISIEEAARQLGVVL